MNSPDISVAPDTLNHILMMLSGHFWERGDFWIGIVLGLGSLGFSWGAFVQAKRAVVAAGAAGRAVKFQTITLELNEVSLKLNAIDSTISYNEARLLLNEVTRRARRYTAPFINHPHLKESITRLRNALETAQTSLFGVRPNDPAEEGKAPNAVFNGMESTFSQIDGLIADLLGLLEGETQNFGEKDGNTNA